MPNNDFRIVELSTKGIKKLMATDIVFKDGINVLMGLTEQGKTSVVETLVMSLQGFKEGGPRDLITHGEEDGSITTRFTLNGTEYCVERTLKKGHRPGVQVYETGEDGKRKKQSSPQKFINDLIPSFGETPGSFLKKTALEKLKYILNQHGVDMTDLESRVEEAKGERDTLIAQRAMFKYAENPPENDISDKLAEKELALKNMGEHNSGIQSAYDKAVEGINKTLEAEETAYGSYTETLKAFGPAETKLATRKLTADFETKEIARLRKELEAREKLHEAELTSIASEEKNLEDSKKSIKKVEEPDRVGFAKMIEAEAEKKRKAIQDTSALETEIETLKKSNESAVKYTEDHKKYIEKNAEVTEANTKVKEARKEVLRTLAEIPAKVEGMQIIVGDEDRPDGIYMEDIFSEEWSGAQGFAIAAKIIRRYGGSRVLIIDQGESIYYDTKAFKKFCEWAKDDGVQVIISVVGERMNPDDDIKGFLVEEGSVREISLSAAEFM